LAKACRIFIFFRTGQFEVLNAITAFGWENFLKVIDYLAGKIAMIKSPQAFLAKMVQGYRQGVSVAAGRVHLRSQLGARGGAFLR